MPVKEKLLYVSGPMSGVPGLNFPEFHRVAALCRAAGFDVINPAELDAEVVGDHEWAFYLRRDIKVLADCDGIVLLEGWQYSKGARLEYHIACELGFMVIHPHQLTAFLEGK